MRSKTGKESWRLNHTKLVIGQISIFIEVLSEVQNYLYRRFFETTFISNLGNTAIMIKVLFVPQKVFCFLFCF